MFLMDAARPLRVRILRAHGRHKDGQPFPSPYPPPRVVSTPQEFKEDVPAARRAA